MMLLTQKIKKAFEKQSWRSTAENEAKDTKVICKFFGGSRWTWYAVEWDGNDTFYGYVISGLGEDCDELGYFSLSELQNAKFPPFGLGTERDYHFPIGKYSLQEIMDKKSL